jgi:ABC-type transport system involved in cytochrome c biogenesis permease subunit
MHILTKQSKILILITVLLLFYWICAKSFSIFAFWESIVFTFLFAVFSAISILYDGVLSRRKKGKKSVTNFIMMAVTAFGLLIIGISIIFINNSAVFLASKTYIESNEQILNEIGDIIGYDYLPVGQVLEDEGEAKLFFFVKGSLKYQSFYVKATMDENEEWQIMSCN